MGVHGYATDGFDLERSYDLRGVHGSRTDSVTL